MIDINLNTNIENTREFQRHLRMKTEEGLMLFIREEFREGRLKPDLELIKQTDDYSKDARLLIKDYKKTNPTNGKDKNK